MKKTAFIDIRASEEELDSLAECGFDVIRLPPLASLPAPVASHPDMLLFVIGSTLICRKCYLDLCPEVFYRLRLTRPDTTGLPSCDAGAKDYPSEVAFNAAIIGKFLFSNTPYTDKEILRLASVAGISTVRVKQGYTSCSTVVLDERHIISSDEGICLEAEKRGINAYRVPPGDIEIDEYQYGFIGGACGVDGKRLITCGDISSYAGGSVVRRAAADCGMETEALCGGRLRDRGKIIII